MLNHPQLADAELFILLRRGRITVAGNGKTHIYGTLRCAHGRRLQRANRVFFADEAEARAAGFRPCARCMHAAYLAWKAAADPIDE